MAKDKYRKNGIVVMLDALGIRTLEIEECGRFLTLRDIIIKKVNDSFPDLEEQYGELCRILNEPDRLACAPQIATFGDTIIVTWEVPSRPELFAIPLLRLVPSQLIWETIFGLTIQRGQKGFLFRGAVSCGEYIHEGDTVLGPALVEAFTWYEAADWAGIIVTPNLGRNVGHSYGKLASLRQPKGRSFSAESKSHLVKYEVPLKKPSSRPMWCASCPFQFLWCVSWPIQFLMETPLRDHAPYKSGKEAFHAAISTFDKPAGTESKYENTIAFFEWYAEEVWPELSKIISPAT